MNLPLNYSLRNLRRRPWRTGATVLGIAIVVFAAVLMLSLSTKDGGWADKSVFKSKLDPRFKKLSELVEDCIVRTKNENQNGWWPTLECGGGEDRYIKERKRFIDSLK